MRIDELLVRLEEVPYPATTDRVVEELDDPEFQLPTGSDRLSEAFDRTGAESFSCPDDARLTLLTSLDERAIGRKEYSDRDPPSPCEPGPDQLAF